MQLIRRSLRRQQQQLQHMLQHGTPQQQEHARQVMAQLQKQREAQAAAALQVRVFRGISSFQCSDCGAAAQNAMPPSPLCSLAAAGDGTVASHAVV